MCVPDGRTTKLLLKMTAVEVSSTWIDWTWIAAAMLPFPNSNSYAMETARRRIRFVFPNPANEPSLQLPEPASHYDWYWDATHLSHGVQQLGPARIWSIRPKLVFLLTTFATLQQNHYSYKCLSSSLEASMIECEDLSTQPNEGGVGGDIVEFLDRHDVQCPENKVHAMEVCERS